MTKIKIGLAAKFFIGLYFLSIPGLVAVLVAHYGFGAL